MIDHNNLTWVRNGTIMQCADGRVMLDDASASDEAQLKIILALDNKTTLVPTSVTMRQARLALLSEGLLPGVAAAIASMPSPQKEAATIEWEYSQTVERNRPFVQLLGQALGLDSVALDGLFILAATL